MNKPTLTNHKSNFMDDEYLLTNMTHSFNNSNILVEEQFFRQNSNKNQYGELNQLKQGQDTEEQDLKKIISQLEMLNENTQYFKEITKKKFEEQQKLIENYHDIIKVFLKDYQTNRSVALIRLEKLLQDKEKLQNQYNDNQNFYDAFYHRLSEIAIILDIKEQDFKKESELEYEVDQIKYLIKFLHYIENKIKEIQQFQLRIQDFFIKKDEGIQIDSIPIPQKREGFLSVNYFFLIELNNLIVILDDKTLQESDKQEQMQKFENNCDQLLQKQQLRSSLQFLNLFKKLVRCYYNQSCLF